MTLQLLYCPTKFGNHPVTRPRGYLVLKGWPQIEERLACHGLRVQKLKEPVELEVETVRLSNFRHEASSYQGEIRMKADVARGKERRSFPAGTLWIPADQPDFEVAAHLFEPEAPDSLLQWGMLRSVVERKEYIEDHILDDQAKELIKNPRNRESLERSSQGQKIRDRRARQVPLVVSVHEILGRERQIAAGHAGDDAARFRHRAVDTGR